MFFPEDVAEGLTAPQAAVAAMPGAFGKGTTMAILSWVRDKVYLTDEPFQKYVASRINAGQ